MPGIFSQLRIRTKIMLILFAAGLPVALSVCFLLYSHYKEEYREAEQKALLTAKVIAYQHQAQVDGIRNLLANLARFPEIKRIDKSACATLLAEVLKQSPFSLTIGISDPQGNVIVTGTQADPVGVAINDRKYFKEALKSKRFSAGEYAISNTVGKPTIHYAMPVLDSHETVMAVLYTEYDLTQLNALLEEQRLPSNSVLNVTDHNGIVIHRYPDHHTVKPGFTDKPHLRKQMTGAKADGVFNDYGGDGVKRLLAFKRLQLYPDALPYLYIRVTTPEREALKDSLRFLSLSALVFALTGIFAFLVSRTLARRYLVEPIVAIAAVSQAVTYGDFSVKTGLPHTGDEIGILAQSFDSMAIALEERQRERNLAEAVQKSLELALTTQIREYQESRAELHQTNDQLLATEEMLRVQLEAVEASEHKFRTSFNLSPVTICLVTYPEGIYLDANEAFSETFGYAREEVIGKSTTELNIWANPDDRNRFIQAVQRDRHISRLEAVMCIKGGSLITVLFSAGVLEVGGRQCLLCVFVDITEERKLEAMLIQSRKMEAVGTLAGGIAHDFNNLLTPIIGYAEMISHELAQYGGKVERAERITQAAIKARDLTKQLMTFGRKQPLNIQVIELNEVLTEFADILHRTIREEIKIRLLLTSATTRICADRTQIEQIIMNLVINARDAIADKGDITVETSHVELDEDFAHNHPGARPGNYVMLTVTDSGCGISSEVMDHIFEPFFTTKSVNEGSGLGLANVYAIVKQHEGTIRVYSEPGKGSVFKIYLPCSDGTPIEDASEPEVVYSEHKVAGTILVVEDNESVRSITCDLLRELGHTVIEADNPVPALSLSTEIDIDLLVTDVIMPNMNGPELYEKLLVGHPDLKVLFMSGYTNNAVSCRFELKEGLNFIQKPFAVNDFTRKITRLLSSKPTNQ